MRRIGRTGIGRAAYDPSMMVSLVLYAYSTNERSSRGIERHCRQDIAYRVITGNRVPDHATIARFVVRHEAALAGLFGRCWGCVTKAGLVASGVVAVDGTKLAASASRDSNVDYDRIAREIIAEAIATDEAEDEQYGDARGDELPPELQTGRAGASGLRASSRSEPATARAGEDAAARRSRVRVSRWTGSTRSGSSRGRRAGEGWLREARRQLEQQRWETRRSGPALAG